MNNKDGVFSPPTGRPMKHNTDWTKKVSPPFNLYCFFPNCGKLPDREQVDSSQVNRAPLVFNRSYGKDGGARCFDLHGSQIDGLEVAIIARDGAWLCRTLSPKVNWREDAEVVATSVVSL